MSAVNPEAWGLTRRDINNFYDSRDIDGMGRISIHEDEAPLLAQAVRPGEIVVEIGTGTGYSTHMLAQRAKHVHTVDPGAYVVENVVQRLPKNVTHWVALADLKQFLADNSVEVGFVFIDGDHSTAGVLIDSEFAKTLSPRAIWWHDGNVPQVVAGIEQAGFVAESILPDGKMTVGGMLKWERGNE